MLNFIFIILLTILILVKLYINLSNGTINPPFGIIDAIFLLSNNLILATEVLM